MEKNHGFCPAIPKQFSRTTQTLKTRLTLPAVIALAALALYGLTLSWGVTFNSLPFTMKIAGWDSQPMSAHPLGWLLTLPLQLLPANWIPVALNFFSALLAAATLGILAKSVPRLPWDCQPDATQIWARRLPVLLGCAMCGLEFSFWRDATAMSGEMVDLLVLAIGIWCVLEFRVKKNPRWLDVAAVIWGLGLAENWAMMLALPFFLIALAWLPGIKKIGKRFFARLVLMLLAGLLLFSLPPVIIGLTNHLGWGVKELWRSAFDVFTGNLSNLYFGFWISHRLMTVVLLMYFFLPVLACLVRIKNEAATNIYGVEKLQLQIFRALRAVLLVVCVWLAFDPEVGPRKIILKQFKASLPLLTFDYLLALGTAFLLGSLMYASQIPPRERVRSASARLGVFLHRHTFTLLAGFSVLAAAGMFVRSAAGIYFARHATLTTAGEMIVHALPPSGGMLLGDDTVLLLAAQSALAQHKDIGHWQTVEMRQFPNARYRAALAANSPAGWSTNVAGELTPFKAIQLLTELARTRGLYYLQPEPGHFIFDDFYPQPLDAVQELKPYAPGTFAIPKLTEPQIAANEHFWQAVWDHELAAARRDRAAAEKSFPHRFALSPVSPDATRQILRWGAVFLNDWGGELQRNDKLPEARQRFKQAQLLNPENPAIAANLFCNSNLLAGKNLNLSSTASLMKSVSGIEQLSRLIEIFGTFDEPAICVMLGEACFNVGWPRQALQQLDRARVLAPEAGVPELAMAKIYSRIGFHQQAIQFIKHLRRFETNSATGEALSVELSMLEAKSWVGLTNAAEASRVLEDVLQKNPDQPTILETVFKSYLAFGYATNALTLLDRLLAKNPDNISALNNKAAVLVQMQRAAEAIPILNHAIALTNLPSMRLNRAIALFQVTDLAAAEAEYQGLQTEPVDKYSVQFGLAQIAEARHDTNAAVNFYASCLTNIVPQSARWLDAKVRMKALKPGGDSKSP